MRTVRSSSRLLGGGSNQGGLSAQEGCLPGGASAWVVSYSGGVYPRMQGRPPPPWTEWQTDRCKNINFPQLCLRTVIKSPVSQSIGGGVGYPG